MIVTLTLDGGEVRPVAPTPTAGEVPGPCPQCGAVPFRISGTGQSIEGHDTYRAEGFCLACGAHVGVIRAVCDTLFGLDEDERVLSGGRYRVF